MSVMSSAKSESNPEFAIPWAQIVIYKMSKITVKGPKVKNIEGLKTSINTRNPCCVAGFIVSYRMHVRIEKGAWGAKIKTQEKVSLSLFLLYILYF